MRNVCLTIAAGLILSVHACKSEDALQEIRVKKSSDIETTDQKNTSPEKNEPQSNSNTKITPKETAQHEGDSLTVTGFIADVFVNEKVAYLNFEKKYPKNIFSCVIFESRFDEFNDIMKFRGKKVEVTGRISFYKNKPQMMLNSEDQIRILE